MHHFVFLPKNCDESFDNGETNVYLPAMSLSMILYDFGSRLLLPNLVAAQSRESATTLKSSAKSEYWLLSYEPYLEAVRNPAQKDEFVIAFKDRYNLDPETGDSVVK